MKRLLLFFLLITASATAQQAKLNLPKGYSLSTQPNASREGFHLVVKGEGENTRYGYADCEGKIIIKAQYPHAHPFRNGYATAAIEGKYYPKYGYLNRNGETVIPFDYYQAEKFNDGLAVVCKVVQGELKYGYIDRTGREAIPIR